MITRSLMMLFIWLCMFGLGCLLSPQSAYADKHGANLALVKAGVIIKLNKFVRWPEESKCNPKESIIYIYGDTPIYKPLLKLKKHLAKVQKVDIRLINNLSDVTPCSVLFFSEDKEKDVESSIALVKDSAILTVGDSEGFGRRGLMVNLYLVKDKVKFEVNQSTLNRSKLSLSYKLLNLARILD